MKRYLPALVLFSFTLYSVFLAAAPKAGIDEQEKHPLLGVIQVQARQGVMIKKIIKGSAAERAGLVPGDTIISVDTIQIRSPVQLYNIIQRYKPGQQIELGYIHAGRFLKINIILGEFSGQDQVRDKD